MNVSTMKKYTSGSIINAVIVALTLRLTTKGYACRIPQRWTTSYRCVKEASTHGITSNCYAGGAIKIKEIQMALIRIYPKGRQYQ